jgi:hypothetical protein
MGEVDIEVFSEWLRRQGHRIVATESARWFDRGPRAFLAFPWHRPVRPSRDELRELFRRERALAVRFSSAHSDGEGTPGYDIVLDASGYGLGDVSRSTRPVVRKALERCEIGPLTFGRYAREGWLLEEDTRARQGRSGSGGRSAFERMARAAEGLAGFEVWGATVGGRLASTLMLARIDDWVVYLSQQSLRELWAAHANHALAFHVTKELRARPGVRRIHYGLQGLDAPPSVDDFKCHLGFARRSVRYRVELHPLVRPFVNGSTYALLRLARARWHRSELLSKGEGLVRVFLDGKRPGAPLQYGPLGRSRA